MYEYFIKKNKKTIDDKFYFVYICICIGVYLGDFNDLLFLYINIVSSNFNFFNIVIVKYWNLCNVDVTSKICKVGNN